MQLVVVHYRTHQGLPCTTIMLGSEGDIVVMVTTLLNRVKWTWTDLEFTNHSTSLGKRYTREQRLSIVVTDYLQCCSGLFAEI